MVLMAAACCQHGALGMPLEKITYHPGPLLGVRQVIQPKLKKGFAGFGLTAGVLQQRAGIRYTERDTNARERPFLRHGRSEGT